MPFANNNDSKKDDVTTTGVSGNDEVKEEIMLEESLTLFDEIRKDILNKELEIQQMMIQNAVISEEKTNGESWSELKNWSNMPIADEKELEDSLLKVKYNLDDLPFDNVNGFDGAKEYDHNIYLPQLLILAHKIDPTFQDECREFFDNTNEQFKIPCHFTAAPVKTKSRCITKAELDYKNESWPHTRNIKDLLRCSVVFDNVHDLVEGCKKFAEMRGKNVDFSGCLGKIIRIKNGFSEISDNSWDKELNHFNYVDVKYNICIYV